MENQVNRLAPELTIKKTIFASVMDNGFWQRWIAHGIDQNYILRNRTKMTSLENWIEKLQVKALEHSNLAKELQDAGDFLHAEHHYRTSALYYNLIQWVYPQPFGDRAEWYKLCIEQSEMADKVSADTISYHAFTFKEKKYAGRVRVPQGKLSGVVIIVCPIDSTKEEMFTYELDFANEGFAVVTFDGTGQGETLLMNGHRGKKSSWMESVSAVVEYVHTMFPHLDINLFGTSSGGSWATEASRHPFVAKTVVVSPAPSDVVGINLPDYFQERLFNIMEDMSEVLLPPLTNVREIGNMLVFHGGKDLMIHEADLINLFNRFAPEKRYIVYEEEGHCCNYKLPEIRHRSSLWFKGADINEI